ncbi:MAG: hypothetical protein NCA08_00790 [Deltaproteobacteria bacterium]|nr:hypothetical protein [Candidatus Deferrimicrobium borealis]
MDESVIRGRIKQLLSNPLPRDYDDQLSPANEILQGTMSIMVAVYGPDTTQVTTFLGSVETFRKDGVLSWIF